MSADDAPIARLNWAILRVPSGGVDRPGIGSPENSLIGVTQSFHIQRRLYTTPFTVHTVHPTSYVPEVPRRNIISSPRACSPFWQPRVHHHPHQHGWGYRQTRLPFRLHTVYWKVTETVSERSTDDAIFETHSMISPSSIVENGCAPYRT